MTRLEAHAKYRQALDLAQREGCRQETVRYLAHTDLFYLLTRVLHRVDADNDWVFQQARMYEAAPDGYLDLVLMFDAQELVAALGEVSDGDVLVLHLHGNLKEEYGGTPIAGEDVVRIIKKGKH